MHRIDKENFATEEGLFTKGDIKKGVAPTIVSDNWLNDLQENICIAIESQQIPLKKGDSSQLITAIKETSVIKKYKCLLHPKGKERLKYKKNDNFQELAFSKSTVAIWGHLYCIRNLPLKNVTSFGDFYLSKNNNKWESDYRSTSVTKIELSIEEKELIYLNCTSKALDVDGQEVFASGVIYLSINYFDESI